MKLFKKGMSFNIACQFVNQIWQPWSQYMQPIINFPNVTKKFKTLSMTRVANYHNIMKTVKSQLQKNSFTFNSYVMSWRFYINTVNCIKTTSFLIKQHVNHLNGFHAAYLFCHESSFNESLIYFIY